MSNIVFIPNIDVGDNRSNPYSYSIKSWEKWCAKHDCELVILDQLLFPVEEIKITWQRWYVFDILEANNMKLGKDDQVALVDADMVVHPDCPNFFEYTDMKWAGVLNNGSYEWVVRSINGYGDLMFDNDRIHPWEYINNGLVIFNNKHKKFVKSITDYYWDNQPEIIASYDKIKCSTDQTIINYLRVLGGIETTYLQDRFNLQDLHSKQLLYHDPSNWWGDSISNLLQSGYVFHINAIPSNRLNRTAGYWIKRLYKEMYPND